MALYPIRRLAYIFTSSGVCRQTKWGIEGDLPRQSACGRQPTMWQIQNEACSIRSARGAYRFGQSGHANAVILDDGEMPNPVGAAREG